ncbi:50S ribosomal protein L35 [bacterium]|nr:50S ribosomal protein L35 [bacterium]
MPKIKTNRAAFKRFRRTGTGKWMRRKAFKRHLMTVKSRKRKRSLKGLEIIDAADMKRVRRLMPNAG